MIPARKLIATLVSACLVGAGLPLPAHATLVGSESVLHPQAADARARIASFLARDDVRAALVGQGVDVSEARTRVQALTDAQALELAGRVDSMPAGGDVLGLLFTIFVILLVTDILGLTKVFPFTRPVR
jgi:hypothetical protein